MAITGVEGEGCVIGGQNMQLRTAPKAQETLCPAELVAMEIKDSQVRQRGPKSSARQGTNLEGIKNLIILISGALLLL